MPDTPISIFISYTHVDSAFVDRLDADLRAQGFETWVDRERLVAGLRWRRELQEAVERAQVLLIVLSPEAVASQNVQIEYDYALDLGKAVIPVYYRQCTVPMELRAIQWADFRSSYEQGIAALVHVLHMQQDKVTPTHPSEQTRPADLGQQPAQKEPAEARQATFNNLPAQLTSLIGREQDIQAVCALMRQPEVRLVTLIGPGGVGKSRLGLAVAQSMLADFADGVCFVPLAPIRNVEQVIPTIAKTLGLWEAADQPLLKQLQAALHERHLLLLLDNFEQVIPAAPSVADLLASCPHLSVLVTSRSALRLVGEYEFPVLPLATPDLTQLPDSQQLAHNAAAALFVARAQAMQPSFRLTTTNARAIAEICVHLDGLPLAIELAAARSKLLPPEALLKRLSHRFEVLTGGAQNLPSRQQTLHNTLQWSYDLLTQAEQRLFRWLSVFVGGCTLEAAEAVCHTEGEQGMEVLEGVTSLLDKSLLQQIAQEDEEPRLQLLETIREYGLDRLQAAGELTAAQQAHASYYLQLAEEAWPYQFGPEQDIWFQRLEQESANMRAAFDWFVGQASDQDVAMALRLGRALVRFWTVHGYWSQGRNLLEKALAIHVSVAAPIRAKSIASAAMLVSFQGDYDRAEELLKEGLSLSRQSGDQWGIALCLWIQGQGALVRHHYTDAQKLLEEALMLSRKVGDKWLSGYILVSLAHPALSQGDASRTSRLLKESIALFQEIGSKSDEAWALIYLARDLMKHQEYARAHLLLEESLGICRETVMKWGMAYALRLLGELAIQQNDLGSANSLLTESVQLNREMGDQRNVAHSLLLLASVITSQGDYVRARALYEESLSIAKVLSRLDLLAASLAGLGRVLAAQREPVWAARLWGAAEQLRKAHDVSLPAALYEQAVHAARTQLGEQAFAAAWAEGRTMTLEQVIDDVLKRGDEVGKQ